MTYETIKTETRGAVELITLNRPQALNALSARLMDELTAALDAAEANAAIRCIVLTATSKPSPPAPTSKRCSPSPNGRLRQGTSAQIGPCQRCHKPVIAAVAGHALGGGCELAMTCDFMIAADNAKFGQPEIKLGVMPGVGGTQRLTRFVGKSKAMEMCLTGRMMDAAEAEPSGLACRVVPAMELMSEVLKVAEGIADPRRAVLMVKETMNRAYETTLTEGPRFERRLFHSLFATVDQKEGMAAFIEKRKPEFRNK